MKTKKIEKETSKDRLINLSLLKKICLEVAEVYGKYELNRHDRSLVSKEMVKFSEIEDREASKEAYESASAGAKKLMGLMKQRKKDL